MTFDVSADTKAILLLTASLIAGRGKPSVKPLTAGEYRRLARRLRDLKRRPAELLESGAREIAAECRSDLDPERLERLLDRGFRLTEAVERWRTRAIWVLSRADVDYPRRLKRRLGGHAPPVLYGCGAVAVLEAGGLAVVGSRNVDNALIEYTEKVGRRVASAERCLVSGGARGVDRAAMRGALEAGGRAAGVLADGLERAAMLRENREALMDGRLVLTSPYDPAARFHVGQAMQRNMLIYALSDAALVVNSDYGKGGTWAGAVEQLDKLKLVPVYVRADDEAGKGSRDFGSGGRNHGPSRRPRRLWKISWMPPRTAGAAFRGNRRFRARKPIRRRCRRHRQGHPSRESSRTSLSRTSSPRLNAWMDSGRKPLSSKRLVSRRSGPVICSSGSPKRKSENCSRMRTCV